LNAVARAHPNSDASSLPRDQGSLPRGGDPAHFAPHWSGKKPDCQINALTRRGAGNLSRLTGIPEAMSIVPDALTAAAFEHVDDLPGIDIHHCSDQLELFTAEAATPRRRTFDLCDFLCLE